MARTSRKQRFSMFAVSAAIVGGGVLLPTSAFAAPAKPQVSEAATLVADHAKSGHGSKGKKDNKGHGKGKKHGKKNQGKKHGGKIKDVKNMPGCKFYKGTVYCEHKPEKPAPTTETPKTETPTTETPKTETPGTETPKTETPGTEVPKTETPGTETPGEGTPTTETGETSGEASPGASG
ncbi:hypothetical protein AB0B78_31200 [Streptomyces sp. NPDC040724]|uniref:hypothetical protein n=1 Tax=Streptomyces sp. NPDC040724 TaxID=3155612 RepID=UPI0033CFF7E2